MRLGTNTADGITTTDAPRRNNYLLHIVLFLATWVTTTYAGASFVIPDTSVDILPHLVDGLLFSTLLMFFLSAHEFGHYFAARAHGVDATLPYYIPMPMIFGTMGAVIRIRSVVPNRRALFDIGVAGPLAGFVVALAYLLIGMLTTKDVSYIYSIHPGYATLPALPEHGLWFGDFLLFNGMRELLVSDAGFFPPMNEIYHYPFLAIGWFGMFVTASNMVPVGQLDGGHILYAMFGERQQVISRWFVRFLTFVGLGALAAMVLPTTHGYTDNDLMRVLQDALGPPLEWIKRNAGWWLRGWFGWLFWVVIIRVIIRIPHPPVPDESPIDRRRMIIGWIALAILVLTFSWTGIYVVGD